MPINNGRRRHPGTIPGMVRFICHGVLGAEALFSLMIYIGLSKHKQLQHPPYNPRVLPVQGLAGIGGAIFFIWNFLTWLPAMATKSEGLIFLFGIVDSIITCLMIVQVAMQATYMPLSVNACNNTQSYGVPPGAPSIFMLAAGYNGTMDAHKSDSECSSFVISWILTLIVIILYLTSSVVGIFALRSDGIPTHVRDFKPNWAIGLFKLIIRIVAVIIPSPVKAAFWFICRYLYRISRRAEPHFPLKTSPHEGVYYAHQEKGNELLRVLGFDIFMLIAKDLHYKDVMNLVLASKAIYNAVFPKIEQLERVKFLRMYSCEDGSRSNCYTCGLQICQGCTLTRPTRSRNISKHVETCKPHCSTCFITVTAEHHSYGAACHCDGKQLQPSRAISAEGNIPFRRTCEFCWRASDGELKQKRKGLVHAALKKQSLELDTCYRCKSRLTPQKLRWWVCAGCGKECRSSAHTD